MIMNILFHNVELLHSSVTLVKTPVQILLGMLTVEFISLITSLILVSELWITRILVKDTVLTLVPESWIYLPGSFEDRGNRSCAACEQNNNLANNNNKKSGQYEEAEPDSKLIPRVPCKKNNPKPDKIRQKNTSRYYGILCYCILCKNYGYPGLRYKYQRSYE